MPVAGDLERLLLKIDGRGYKSYREIRGSYRFDLFDLHIDHVQGDPFAAPSRMRVVIDPRRAGFPPDAYSGRARRTALEDFLTRSFAGSLRSRFPGTKGSGGSGRVSIDLPGQEILERSSCLVRGGRVEVRFRAGLPGAGRTILGKEAAGMLLRELPPAVEESLLYASLDREGIGRHLDANEDQDCLRKILRERSLVAFVADGSILPRRSGVDDRPLIAKDGRAPVPFFSPPSMLVEIDLPHAGRVKGMGMEEGVTLIVGGGFHGKSTLLRAVERGVYNHIPGDGRELVVTREDAVKIRAEDGRSVSGVDIRPFISNLPLGVDTAAFTTENASGSTSQAANIIEAIEVGCRLLLIDEDTSATNFMIRDAAMQELVPKEKEPITPFIDRVRLMAGDKGISTVLVMGGSGDYLGVADTVIMMDSCLPRDVTAEAAAISKRGPARIVEGGEDFGEITHRFPLRSSFDPGRGKRKINISVKGSSTILFGRTTVDLSSLEQLVSESQTRAIGDMIYYYSTRYAGDDRSIAEGLGSLMSQVDADGLDGVVTVISDGYSRPRIFELAAAINRMRPLRVEMKREG